jgi:hypothetical protein
MEYRRVRPHSQSSLLACIPRTDFHSAHIPAGRYLPAATCSTNLADTTSEWHCPYRGCGRIDETWSPRQPGRIGRGRVRKLLARTLIPAGIGPEGFRVCG